MMEELLLADAKTRRNGQNMAYWVHKEDQQWSALLGIWR